MEYQQANLYQSNMEDKIQFSFHFELSVDYEYDFDDLEGILTNCQIKITKKGQLNRSQRIQSYSSWCLSSDTIVAFTLSEALDEFFRRS